MNVQVGGNTVTIQVQSSGLGAALALSRDMSAEVAAAAASAEAAQTAETGAETAQSAAAASAAAAAATLAGAALKSANLSDMTSAATARTNIGADLAANVNFTPEAASAPARTTEDKLREVPSIYDFPGATVTAKFQAAVVSSATEIFVPGNATVVLTAAIAPTGDKRIFGPGTIDASGLAVNPILASGGATQIADLSADITPFTHVFAFCAAHGLVAGDMFAVWNPTPSTGSPYQTEYHDGTHYQVLEVVSSTSVRIWGVAKDAYVAADVEVYKLSASRFCMEGLTIIPPSAGIPLIVEGFCNPVLKDIRIVSGSDQAGIYVRKCYNVLMSNLVSTVYDGEPGYGYGVIIGGCTNVIFDGAVGLNGERHCLALGCGNETAGGMLNDAQFTNLILNNDASSGLGSADMHGNVRRVSYKNCILAGANMAGYDVSYVGCRITGTPNATQPGGTVIYGTECGGGVYLVENCDLISDGQGSMQASHIHLDFTQRNKPVTIILRNNRYINVGADPSGTSVVRITGSSGSSLTTINVIIDGGEFIGSAPPAEFLNIGGNEDLTSKMTIEMRSPIKGIKRVFSASLSANYAIPKTGCGLPKGMKRQGYGNLTLTRDVAVDSYRYDVETIEGGDITFTPPVTADSFEGDQILISRPAGGASSLLIGAAGAITSLAASTWCIIGFRGDQSTGSWQLLASSSF
jgi:hypothetical protein